LKVDSDVPDADSGSIQADSGSSSAVRDIQLIALAGPASAKSSELSGMAWHGDTLVLLPQYADKASAVYSLTRSEIQDYLDHKSATPLTPRAVPFFAQGLRDKIAGFEGFEAIAFSGDKVFLTIEADESSGMKGYLVSGTTDSLLQKILLDVDHLAPIPAQADIGNITDEALVILGEKLLTFYEANGKNVNPSPIAHAFNLDLAALPSLPFPNLEYRVTDATPPDADGRFWVINYFYPGDADSLKPATDPLSEKWAPNQEPREDGTVERLVQFQVSAQGVTLVDRAPLWIQVPKSKDSHNWEGIAPMGNGFLLVTNTYPTTLFGYVSLAP